MEKNEKYPLDVFFKKMERIGLALSYGDVREKTGYSEILPGEVNLQTRFSRNVPLNIPIVSSPMDTVTEFEMAIEMAKLGGLGIIHKALSPFDQSMEIARVKHHLNAFIQTPVCVFADDTVEAVMKMKAEKLYKFFSFPVLDRASGQVIGIVSSSDFDFCSNVQDEISLIMSKNIEKFSVVSNKKVSVSTAYDKMMSNGKKILPVFDKLGAFRGIYTLSDVKRIMNGDFKDYNLDSSGNLRVGAAVGVGADLEERLRQISREKVDVLVIDSAHGDSKSVFEVVKFCKKNYPEIDVVAGNISEGDAAKRLVQLGVDGLRVGQGPGSICTTRIVAGIGCPQVTAIYNCARAVRGSDVPVCGDGGIEYSGDVTIALAAGAANVMLGKVLAGTKEAPGMSFVEHGVTKKFYRGMGSLGAMMANKASRERYGQGDAQISKLVPEGVDGSVEYKGEVADIVFQFLGGLKSGFGYVGAKDLPTLHKTAEFYRITGSGLRESHPHGLSGFKSAPNY